MNKDPSAWWDKTWSPVTGCTPAGKGCERCHSLARMRRHLPALRGEGNADVPATTVLCHVERVGCDKMLELAKKRTPQVILCCMMGDLFHELVPIDFAMSALAGFVWANDLRLHPELRESDWRNRDTPLPLHQLVVLTKRPARAVEAIGMWLHEDGPYEPDLMRSVMLLASVATQAEADAACSCLLQLRSVRWGLHVEPMIEAIDLTTQPRPGRPVNGATAAECSGALERWQTTPMRAKLRDGSSWIVCGAEQGPGARPFNPDWARSLLEQCRAAGVPFWMKQFSGRTEPPEDLRVRETPWR